ncbi:antitoxin [Sphingomonas sp. HMWF008]|nr:antitoxin [Sphingomonas sp. HMWF008]
MNWRDHIHSDPGILGGKPVVRGTRISVELILEYFEDGGTVADILDAYPHVTEADVRAAIAFARDLLHEEASAAQRRAA